MPNWKMVDRYTEIKNIPDLNKLICLGIIPMVYIDWMVIYEFYLSERINLGKMQSYSNTAENYKMSETQIRNIVAWLSGK